jgi:hypothetical protein
MRCERLLEKDSCKQNRNSPSCKRWQFALNGCSEQRRKKGRRLDENKDDDEEYAVVDVDIVVVVVVVVVIESDDGAGAGGSGGGDEDGVNDDNHHAALKAPRHPYRVKKIAENPARQRWESNPCEAFSEGMNIRQTTENNRRMNIRQTTENNRRMRNCSNFFGDTADSKGDDFPEAC